jgi:hypothetical protein
MAVDTARVNRLTWAVCRSDRGFPRVKRAQHAGPFCLAAGAYIEAIDVGLMVEGRVDPDFGPVVEWYVGSIWNIVKAAAAA